MARFPHRLIAAALLTLDRQAQEQQTQPGSDPDENLRRSVAPNKAFRRARLATAATREPVVEYPDLRQVPEDAMERGLLRAAVAETPELVRLYAQRRGRDEAIRVYGLTAVTAMDASLEAARAGL
ncbi:hypothetical protein [Streptomyces sp. KAU_LT]|uniref:hypothetical protein n=1 Tax=Streptomyces sp. KAU_LT TaxID=3046669 RepID=UPI0024B7B680|nr:hypothetical protein [Streptomyces sp. KAU_LT]MDI9834992.1 hypothetical protein [Streptomyces sp. KAU_LT]